jgi:hypothetical protein
MKKRNDHHTHPQQIPQKVAPMNPKTKTDQTVTFHQINTTRAQHFRDRAHVAEMEAK